MKKVFVIVVFAATLAMALVLVGCKTDAGGDDGNNPPTTTTVTVKNETSRTIVAIKWNESQAITFR